MTSPAGIMHYVTTTARFQPQLDYDRFFDLSLDLLAIANFEGYFLRVNPAWEETLGYSVAELMAKPYMHWVHPDDRAATRSAVQGLSQGTSAIRFENRYRCKNGSYRWLSWSSRPFDEQKLVYAVAHDITDRRQLEIADQKNKETISHQLGELEAVYCMAPIGLCFMNTKLQFVRINESLAAINGFTVADHIGKTLRQLLPEMADQLEPLHQKVIASGQPILDREMSGATAAQPGVVRHWLASYYPQTDSHGQVSGVNVMVLDITDRQQIQAELEARNYELDSFVHTVSHDLKAPLRGISNLSQWIEDDLEGSLSSETQAQMKLLRSRVNRMSSTINGLLDYARVGRTGNSNTLVSIAELLAEIIDSLAVPPNFTIAVAPYLPTFNANRLLLSQVFTNLISNSIKHHHRADGKIHISGQEYGDSYRFVVADDGPGIDPCHHDKIFMIFQTVDRKSNPDSTGIGLSIVRKIIETAGGTIQIDSAIGEGAAFCFTWPKQS